jgi:branched-chain amino acid transport system substrate-binding protein
MKSKPLIAILSLLFAAFLLVACGDDDDKNGGGGAAIKIGLMAPFSGPLEGFGKAMRQAAEMAAEEITNAGGLLKGQKLVIVSEDDGTDPDKAEAAAKKLKTDAAIIALVGPATSSSAARVAEKETSDIVAISPSATSPGLEGKSKNFFRTISSDKWQGAAAAKYVDEKLGTAKDKNIAVLHIDNSYGEGLGKAFRDELVKRNYTGTITLEKYPEQSDYGTYDFSQHVTNVFGNQPEVVFMVTYFEDGAKFTAAVKTAGVITSSYTPTLVGCDGNYSSQFLSDAEPTVIDGMIGTSPTPPKSDANYIKFANAFKAKFNIAADKDPELFSETTYDAVYLLAYAIEKAGKAERGLIQAQLKAMSGPPGDKINVAEWAKGKKAAAAGDIDYFGASGEIDWDDNNDTVPGNYIIWTAKGGKFEVLENNWKAE